MNSIVPAVVHFDLSFKPICSCSETYPFKKIPENSPTTFRVILQIDKNQPENKPRQKHDLLHRHDHFNFKAHEMSLRGGKFLVL